MSTDNGQLYFALDFDTGDLVNLGNLGDFDAAEQATSDLGINAVWILDEETALGWANFIRAAINRNLKDLESINEFEVWKHHKCS